MGWLREHERLVRIRDPAKGWRTYTGDLGPVFQNDLLGRILAAVNGDTGVERRLGMAPGDPVCNGAGMAREASAAPGVSSLGESEKGNKQEAQRRGLPADS
jgi:hypothetical protein